MTRLGSGQRQRLSQVQGSHRRLLKQYSSDSDRCRKFAALYFRTAAEVLVHNA